MKHLVSVNYKFFSIKPEDLVMDWYMNDFVDGAEIFVRLDNEDDIAYLTKISSIMRYAGLTLQVHAPNLDMLNDLDTLRYYNSISKLYGSKLLLVSHPVHSESISNSVLESIDNLRVINELINELNFNLEVCVENLNPLNGLSRTRTSDIEAILSNSSKGMFCWDIGHAVHAGDSTELSNLLKYKLRDIHLHDLNDGKDHYPFKYGSVDIYKISEYLDSLNYNGSIVHEIALDFLEGETTKQRHQEFLNEIKRVKVIVESTIKVKR